MSAGGDHSNDPLRTELYTGLQRESARFLEKMSELWRQKLILIGGFVAFLVAKESDWTRVGLERGALLVAIAVIPAIALLLDLKHFEYAAHARSISLFIRKTWPGTAIARYEASQWADDRERSNDATGSHLSILRTLFTSLTAALPTLAMSGVALTVFVIEARTLLRAELDGNGSSQATDPGAFKPYEASDSHSRRQTLSPGRQTPVTYETTPLSPTRQHPHPQRQPLIPPKKTSSSLLLTRRRRRTSRHVGIVKSHPRHLRNRRITSSTRTRCCPPGTQWHPRRDSPPWAT
jgi:hypothetical protein